MRVVEGQYGTLQAWVVPQQAPKTCPALVHPIRPLSLQQRVAGLAGDPPLNELKITGSWGPHRAAETSQPAPDCACRLFPAVVGT